MGGAGLVLGLLDVSGEIAEPRVAVKARELTIAWTRFKYFGAILEGASINGILDRALEGGFGFCLIQAHGHILSEIWHPEGAGAVDVFDALNRWMLQKDFFVTGHILDGGGGQYGLSRACLLVNLTYYRRLGKPAFDPPARGSVELVVGSVEGTEGDVIERLEPTVATVTRTPALTGWNFIQASLASGLTVFGFDETITDGMLDLDPADSHKARQIGPYLDQGIAAFDSAADHDWLGANERRFLDNVHTLTQNLRRGVFVWNLESYEDVEEPPEGFAPPLSALYTVAAGLKPNRILETHGFDASTRVVVFDYSPPGLAFRRLLHEHWDGRDYPTFLRYLFDKLPSAETFYCLWDNVSPETVNWDDVNRRWEQELEAWGGKAALARHWARYRQLPQEYVLCDVLGEPEGLLAAIRDTPSSVIWWSNAFFSVFSNWFYTAEQRRHIYTNWIEALASKAPGLFLYGADSNNISVNFVKAREYWLWYREHGGDELQPGKRHRHELRF